MADGHSGASPARRHRSLSVMPDLIGHLLSVASGAKSPVLHLCTYFFACRGAKGLILHLPASNKKGDLAAAPLITSI